MASLVSEGVSISAQFEVETQICKDSDCRHHRVDHVVEQCSCPAKEYKVWCTVCEKDCRICERCETGVSKEAKEQHAANQNT